MSGSKVEVSRGLVGVIAAACITLALGLMFWDSWENVWCAAFMRVGMVMSAIWLAMPTAQREAAWANVSPLTLVGLFAALVFVVYSPRRALPVVIGALVVGFFLRPRPNHRRRSQP